jgi:PIN domain nuclease of toxin-antitoxin system
VRSILDTHFLLWIVGGSRRLTEFEWIDRYRPWGVSPVSFLELAYLGEAGRIDVKAEFLDLVLSDPRFDVDDITLLAMIRHAIPLTWTRDPFDRLLAAHSSARRVPFCSVDENVVRHHRFLPRELKAGRRSSKAGRRS